MNAEELCGAVDLGVGSPAFVFEHLSDHRAMCADPALKSDRSERGKNPRGNKRRKNSAQEKTKKAQKDVDNGEAVW